MTDRLGDEAAQGGVDSSDRPKRPTLGARRASIVLPQIGRSWARAR